MDWAQQLKSYRRRSGMLQKQLAHALGVDVITLSRWERGQTEPSAASTAKLRDLLLLGRDPADLPLVKQQMRLGGSLAIINLSTGRYIYTQDPQNLNGLGTENLAGQCSVKLIQNDMVRAHFEEAGGYRGGLDRGVVSYEFIAPRPGRSSAAPVRTDGTVVRHPGFQPVVVLHRHIVHGCPPEGFGQVHTVTEDDLIGR